MAKDPQTMPDNTRIVDAVTELLKAGKSPYGSWRGRVRWVAAEAAKIAILIALLLLAAADVHARERVTVFIEPQREVPISRAMVAEQLCLLESTARTITEASAHALWCNLRHRR